MKLISRIDKLSRSDDMERSAWCEMLIPEATTLKKLYLSDHWIALLMTSNPLSYRPSSQ